MPEVAGVDGDRGDGAERAEPFGVPPARPWKITAPSASLDLALDRLDSGSHAQCGSGAASMRFDLLNRILDLSLNPRLD